MSPFEWIAAFVCILWYVEIRRSFTEGRSRSLSRQHASYFYFNDPRSNHYPEQYQQPYQPPYQESYQGPYQPLYQQPYNGWPQITQGPGYYNRDHFRDLLSYDLKKPPPRAQRMQNSPFDATWSPLEEDTSDEHVSKVDIESETMANFINGIKGKNDLRNKWVNVDPKYPLFAVFLNNMLTKRRHWKGTVKDISSAQVNQMDDMILFKIKFSYVKPNANKSSECSTLFSEMGGTLSLGTMECDGPDFERRQNGQGWTTEDPDNTKWLLPLMIASKMQRTNGYPHHIEEIRSKTTDEKTMYKVKFVMTKNNKPKHVSCNTVFSVSSDGPLRPVQVDSFICDDGNLVKDRSKTNHKRKTHTNTMNAGKPNELREKRIHGNSSSHEPNLRESGIAKWIDFDESRHRNNFLVPVGV